MTDKEKRRWCLVLDQPNPGDVITINNLSVRALIREPYASCKGCAFSKNGCEVACGGLPPCYNYELEKRFLYEEITSHKKEVLKSVDNAAPIHWERIPRGERLPRKSYLLKDDGTLIDMPAGEGILVGQDAYYLPCDELKKLPKGEFYGKIRRTRLSEMFKF